MAKLAFIREGKAAKVLRRESENRESESEIRTLRANQGLDRVDGGMSLAQIRQWLIDGVE